MRGDRGEERERNEAIHARNEVRTRLLTPLAKYLATLALLSDARYALLSAQSLAELVISVIVAAELLKRARLDPRRLDIAASDRPPHGGSRWQDAADSRGRSTCSIAANA